MPRVVGSATESPTPMPNFTAKLSETTTPPARIASTSDLASDRGVIIGRVP